MSNSYIPNNEHFLKRARNIRNELLNKTDRYFLIDYPIASDKQLIIKAYRQELRDFINDNKEKNIKWRKNSMARTTRFYRFKYTILK